MRQTGKNKKWSSSIELDHGFYLSMGWSSVQRCLFMRQELVHRLTHCKTNIHVGLGVAAVVTVA